MEVQRAFSVDYMDDGNQYKNAENKLKKMREKVELEEPDESGDELIDDSWIQAVKTWITVEDAENAEKEKKISKAKKKKADVYNSYRLRADLALNKGKKKLVTLPDYKEEDEEGGYFTENRDKSTSCGEDENEVDIDSASRSAFSAVNTSTSTFRSSSAVPTKRKKQSQKLPRTERGPRFRKPRVEEMAGKLTKLDSVLDSVSFLISGEKDKENCEDVEVWSKESH